MHISTKSTGRLRVFGSYSPNLSYDSYPKPLIEMRFTIFVVAAAVFSQVVLAIPLTPEDSDGSIKFLKTDVTDITLRGFQTSGSNEVRAQPNVTLPNRSNQIDATQEENGWPLGPTVHRCRSLCRRTHDERL
ncbi:hypothetical protein BN946_scf184915.g34 [Trametes cinnabarina]|uniref:Uncharacterized protein n=1 Tax=Pycnoporus cinnabarinus TaxID=5643 RepID=A0A060SBF7_PYCCI|nr:hypothetical protein BN946_scf184915.g34 [Trametes cinnabarina]